MKIVPNLKAKYLLLSFLTFPLKSYHRLEGADFKTKSTGLTTGADFRNNWNSLNLLNSNIFSHNEEEKLEFVEYLGKLFFLYTKHVAAYLNFSSMVRTIQYSQWP